ncbi:Uncharacterised protein [Vibrio cholerae]|nr:Uncharacterised protein [Vibrio cholerae]
MLDTALAAPYAPPINGRDLALALGLTPSAQHAVR